MVSTLWLARTQTGKPSKPEWRLSSGLPAEETKDSPRASEQRKQKAKAPSQPRAGGDKEPSEESKMGRHQGQGNEIEPGPWPERPSNSSDPVPWLGKRPADSNT